MQTPLNVMPIFRMQIKERSTDVQLQPLPHQTYREVKGRTCMSICQLNTEPLLEVLLVLNFSGGKVSNKFAPLKVKPANI